MTNMTPLQKAVKTSILSAIDYTEYAIATNKILSKTVVQLAGQTENDQEDGGFVTLSTIIAQDIMRLQRCQKDYLKQLAEVEAV